jgi:hypothetical protein
MLDPIRRRGGFHVGSGLAVPSCRRSQRRWAAPLCVVNAAKYRWRHLLDYSGFAGTRARRLAQVSDPSSAGGQAVRRCAVVPRDRPGGEVWSSSSLEARSSGGSALHSLPRKSQVIRVRDNEVVEVSNSEVSGGQSDPIRIEPPTGLGKQIPQPQPGQSCKDEPAWPTSPQSGTNAASVQACRRHRGRGLGCIPARRTHCRDIGALRLP